MFERIVIFYGAIMDVMLAAFCIIGIFVSNHIVSNILFLFAFVSCYFLFSIRKNMFLDQMYGKDDGDINEEDFVKKTTYALMLLSILSYLILG